MRLRKLQREAEDKRQAHQQLIQEHQQQEVLHQQFLTEVLDFQHLLTINEQEVKREVG